MSKSPAVGAGITPGEARPSISASSRGSLPVEVRATLLEAMEARGWTIPGLAERVGLSRSHMWRLMSGHARPSRTAAIAIASVLDLDAGAAALLEASSRPLRGA